MVETTCAVCGKIIISKTRPKRFCSGACASKNYYQTVTSKIPKYCRYCGAELVRGDYRAVCDECKAINKGKKITKQSKGKVKLPKPSKTLYRKAHEIGFSHGEIIALFEQGKLEEKIKAKKHEEHGDYIYDTWQGML